MLPQSIGRRYESCGNTCKCVGVCVDRVRQGRNEGESVMKVTGERANGSECVSEPTTPQWFSGVSQLGHARARQRVHLERVHRLERTWNDLERVSVSRVGACYVASVGRVRVAGACPLGVLALACEWAMVRRVRQVVTNVRWNYMRPCA